MKRRENGITLIALVVTIVVLLILAGVSISMLIGENGIVTQATESRLQTQIGEEKEAINLAMQALLIDKVYNPSNYQDGIINGIQLKNEMDKSTPKPVSITLDDTSKNLTVIFDESRGNRTYIVGQDGIIQSEEEQTPVEISSIYAKLYSYNDGSGDVLELSSNPDFEDTSGIVTLKENYGDIGGNHYYFDCVESEENGQLYYEEKGLPPWIEKRTETVENKGTAIYYILPNENIINVKIVDKIEPAYTSYWFGNLTNLKNIENIENIDTKNTVDMNHMFFGCSSLMMNLDLTGWDIGKVTELNYMFAYSGITNLNLDNWNTSNITDMSALFFECNNLQTLSLKNWDTSNVIDMGGIGETDTGIGMFFGCLNLTNLDLNSFDTSNVIDMAGMFYDCSGLKNLNLSNFNTSNVTDMSGMFSGCSSLTSLNLSNFNTSNVTDMNGMFSGCSSLTSLNLSNFNTSNVTNMSAMFSGLNLIELDLSKFDTSNVVYMDSMFAGCTGITSLNLSTFDTSNVVYMNGMFESCENLQTLNLNNWNTSNVVEMGDSRMLSGGMFYNCTNLVELDLSSFDTRKVTDMGAMFGKCEKLNTIYIGEYWSTSQANTENMFFNINSANINFIKK